MPQRARVSARRAASSWLLGDVLASSASARWSPACSADLVGFTALAESADPEDIDRLLGEYSQVTRHAVEIHGGIIEKYIGDAVVAIFGVPAAHEDDAERAIHAALRIHRDVESVLAPDGQPIKVRIGVNTGEAVARLDVPTQAGEGFLAGDAVNTAARLQAAAPPKASSWDPRRTPDEPHLPLRRARTAGAQGEGRSGTRVAGGRNGGAHRSRPPSRLRHGLHRSPARARAPLPSP